MDIKNSKVSRRKLLGISTMGSLAILASPSFANSWISKKELLAEMIYKNVASSKKHSSLVESFVDDLVAGRLELLEDKSFINQEFKKWDQHKLERFVVTQYLTSDHYLRSLAM